MWFYVERLRSPGGDAEKDVFGAKPSNRIMVKKDLNFLKFSLFLAFINGVSFPIRTSYHLLRRYVHEVPYRKPTKRPLQYATF